jgi:hypothetical protein
MRIPIIEKYKNKIGFYFNPPIKKGKKKDFVFIHIGKTGGTSITKIIGENFQKHSTAKDIIEIIGKDKWTNTFKFTVVRNPWDQVHSWYKYRVKLNQSKMATNKISFKDWVACTYGENKDPYYYYRPKSFVPQVERLKNDEGIIDMDKIIRFENLREEYKIIADELGINSELPHINKTKKTNYRDFYDETTQKIIEDWFHEDIEYFGYTY